MSNETTMDMKDLIAKQLEILGHSGLGLSEVRTLPDAKSFYSKDPQAVIDYAITQKADTYVGINPRSKEGNTNDCVEYLTCLVIDIDPIRAKGQGSTDEQLALAHAVGNKIHDEFGGTVRVSSGSGCHVYFPLQPIRVVNRKALNASIKKWFDAIKKRYEVDGVRIDSIYDLPRIIRAWGSHNHKSNRPCVPLDSFRGTRFEYTFDQTKAEETEGTTTNTEDRFSRLVSTNAALQRIVSGETDFPSRSEADYAFVSILSKAYFTPQEIFDLKHRNPKGRKDDMKLGDVERIFQKTRDAQVAAVSLVGSPDSYLDGLRKRKMGIKTGFGTLDKLISGFKPQKVIVLAARPTEGKTTLTTQIMTSIADQGHMCLMFPTEVGAESIYDKIVSARTKIDLKKFQNGDFTDEEFHKIKETKDYLSKMPLAIVENFGLSVDDIEEQVRNSRPSVFVVDYLQALKYENPGDAGEMAGAVRKIKEIAGDYNCTAILCSQLLREGDGKSPFSLSRLKGTGAIEEFGDVVAYLYSEPEAKFKDPRPVELAVVKSKYSAVGSIPILFRPSHCYFEEDVTGTTTPQ